MDHYVIYRITETINVLFFIALAILIFGFFPVTALMIVLLALLNDIPIMTIAWDNVLYSRSPEEWEMRKTLTLATLMGITGVTASFLLLAIARGPLHLDFEVVQSFVFLKLMVAGHLTIFVARTRGPFWSVRPGSALLWSTIGTKAIATLIVVYGIGVTPIGWPLAILVWIYSLIWEFGIMDPVKIYTYRLIDHTGIQFAR